MRKRITLKSDEYFSDKTKTHVKECVINEMSVWNQQTSKSQIETEMISTMIILKSLTDTFWSAASSIHDSWNSYWFDSSEEWVT